MNYILKKYPHFLKSMTWKIKYDQHEKKCKKKTFCAQKLSEETKKKRTKRNVRVDFFGKKRNNTC